jgi:hypothetical protein
LSKLGELQAAQACYEAAREVYENLGLQKNVEDCDEKIRKLAE